MSGRLQTDGERPQRDGVVISIENCPFLDPVRGDARFQALLRKMHLG
jgi:hypothetical protein